MTPETAQHSSPDVAAPTRGASAPQTLHPASARPPLALPAAAFTGPLIAILLVAAGAVGIRDGIVAAGWVGGTLWTQTAAQWIDGVSFTNWMIPLAIAAIVVGVLLVLAAVKPRRTTAVPVTADTDVWIEHSAVAHIAADAARSVPGVLSARATATRRTVTVRAQVTGDDRSGITAAVTEQVQSALEPLHTAPKVVVRSTLGGRS